MTSLDVVQSVASFLLVLVGSAAFWGYWKDRKKSSAEGVVAQATVEIQIEASRVANLEQRFGFAQRAWDDERASLHRQVDRLERELVEERAERERLTRELAAVTAEVAELRRGTAS